MYVALVPAQQQGDGVSPFRVARAEPGEVGVEQHVTAQDKAWVAFPEELRDPPDPAPGAQQLRLGREVQAHPRRAVAAGRLLQELLWQDPRLRTPLFWETIHPVESALSGGRDQAARNSPSRK